MVWIMQHFINNIFNNLFDVLTFLFEYKIYSASPISEFILLYSVINFSIHFQLSGACEVDISKNKSWFWIEIDSSIVLLMDSYHFIEH